MSTLLPTEMNLENPMRVALAQSSTTEQIAPDWELMAMGPSRG